ncbi:hypothetical protein C922_05526 [Plasmodium inui San Antonio 1]|uniref:Uncharacterized protein n=1 Tax=Plasmodium inui San Antonio 1 TaxID=1237626 RepID=W7AFN0_9APIC|nr:hypothetical protein C922_05526 [Plasmodium inui San Antonio 1]EUD64091.1 hypothetical protein C922_05526 [Plasmodium inui San Antonio 1]
MKTSSCMMYYNPAHNLSLAGSAHAVVATTHNSTGTARLRNTRLLLTHVQRHLKLVYASESHVGRDYTYILKNKGNINSSCKEFLIEDFQRRSLTPTWDTLDRRWPAHIIQELINNEAIMCESSKGGLSGNVNPCNSFIHNIRNIQIVMITHNKEILQKIRYIKERVLTTRINIIIEYHRELSVAVQETLSMRNKTFSTEVKHQAKYLLDLQREMRKMHTLQQRLNEGILVGIAIFKIRNHQQEFGRIRTIIIKQ